MGVGVYDCFDFDFDEEFVFDYFGKDECVYWLDCVECFVVCCSDGFLVGVWFDEDVCVYDVFEFVFEIF